MSSLRSRYCLLTLTSSFFGVLLTTALAAQSPDSASDPAVATYCAGPLRTTISHSQWQDYAAFRGWSVTDPHPAQLEALALQLRLAAAARDRTQSAQEKFALEQERIEVLSRYYRQSRPTPDPVSEELVQARLERLREERGLQRPTRVHLREIFKRLPEGADAATRSALRTATEEVRDRLLAGEDISELARLESDSQTASSGGRLGVFRPGGLPPALEEVAFGLDPGEVSPVLESETGFLILKVERRVEAETVPEAEARRLVREKLEREQAERLAEQRRQELLAGAHATIDPTEARQRQGSETVLRAAGRDLSADELGWLARSSTPYTLAQLTESEVSALLEEQAMRAEEARRQARSPSTEELERRLRWSEVRTLARLELERRVQGRFTPPTREELERYIAEHPDRFQRREHYDLRVVRIDDASHDGDAAALVVDLARRLRAGEVELEAVARDHSDHRSRERGGAVGWWSRKRLAAHGPLLLRTVTALAAGQTSDAIRQDRSWWFLQLLGTEPARPMTFEEARSRADRFLGNERVRTLQNAVEAELTQELGLEFGPASASEERELSCPQAPPSAGP